MPDLLRVLVVEDSIDDAFLIVRALQHSGFEVVSQRVASAAEMKAALQVSTWDVILCDYDVPQFGAPAAFELYQQGGSDAPFIVVSGVMGADIAVEMLKAGANHYVMKSALSRLVLVVRQELRAAEERRIRSQTEAAAGYLASLVESCDDAIIGQTLLGSVLSWNAAAERLYGYKAAEMLGQSIKRLFPRYRPQELPEMIARLNNGSRVDSHETVHIRKDGAPVEVSLAVSAIRDSRGRLIGASLVCRDITERKRQERERLALIQDLTAALAHLGQSSPVHSQAN